MLPPAGPASPPQPLTHMDDVTSAAQLVLQNRFIVEVFLIRSPCNRLLPRREHASRLWL
jgi:hypothetical protein